MASFKFQVQQPVTVEALLKDQWQAGKKTIHFMRMAKSVTDENGNSVEWNVPIETGTTLQFTIPDAQSTYQENPQHLKVLYEDEHILAAHKPAGIATHPSADTDSDTFMNIVFSYVKQQGGDYAEHIHRLDKGTSGVVLIAKHPIAKALFDRLIEQNELTRIYHAEVEGIVRRPRGTINRPIGKDRHHATRRRVSPTGQAAVTHFKVLERKEQSTLVEARLETGRTHQIRVHLAYLGHPVVGDHLYGAQELENQDFLLTASRLQFVHPFTNEQLTIEC